MSKDIDRLLAILWFSDSKTVPVGRLQDVKQQILSNCISKEDIRKAITKYKSLPITDEVGSEYKSEGATKALNWVLEELDL